MKKNKIFLIFLFGAILMTGCSFNLNDTPKNNSGGSYQNGSGNEFDDNELGDGNSKDDIIKDIVTP